MEALRALKRRLSDIVYRQLVADQKRLRAVEAGPGGHVGAATESSAAGSHPSTGTSDKSLPGPTGHDATPNGATRPDPTAAPAQALSA